MRPRPGLLLPTVTLGLWLCLNAPLGAQETRGRVIDATSREPLPQSLVSIKQADQELWAGSSDADGFFAAPWHRWLGQEVTIEVRSVGYAFLARRIRVDSALLHASLEVPMRAIPFPLVLDTLVVTGLRSRRLRSSGFYDRAATGFGHFITEEDIERRRPTELTDLFRTVPGVTVVPDGRGRHRVYVMRAAQSGFRGPCEPTVVVDGVVLAGRFDYLMPQDIAGIEIYRGPAETPARFGGAEASCGVIVFWTK